MASLFDSHQRSTLEAATGRIIPANRDPGALDAGVIDYIENTLATYEAEHAPLYADGIQELGRLAHERFGSAAFIQLSADQQDQILDARDMIGGGVDNWGQENWTCNAY